MRHLLSTLFAVAVSTCAFGQFDFECHPLGPVPGDSSLTCDGIASNSLGLNSGVTNTPACGFPVSGSKYLQLVAAGPVAVPAGGPLARPLSGNSTEVRIPIPSGSTVVSLQWNFFNNEGSPQPIYNDGFSIDVVDVNGTSLANLAYADTNTALATSTCTITGEVAPAGVKGLFSVLPPLMPCSYLSIVVWNGGDNSFASRAFIDFVAFDSTVAGCTVPCIPVAGIPALACSSPSGIPGSLLVNMSSLPPGGTYLLAATLNAGTYPNGWFYGIDIPISELGNLINAGFPFSGPVGSTGCAAGQASIGPFFGAPSALSLYMVALAVPAGSLASTPTAVTNAVNYTIP